MKYFPIDIQVSKFANKKQQSSVSSCENKKYVFIYPYLLSRIDKEYSQYRQYVYPDSNYTHTEVQILVIFPKR